MQLQSSEHTHLTLSIRHLVVHMRTVMYSSSIVRLVTKHTTSYLLL